MKTIFNLTEWSDPDRVAQYFRSRLDWMPMSIGTQSYFYNWAKGLPHDYCRWRSNEPGQKQVYDLSVEHSKDYFPLVSIPIEPFLYFDRTLKFLSTCLVGNFLIDRGRLTIEAELSCHPEVIESFWALSPARYTEETETILPEYDFWETNTPYHVDEMSTAVILNYSPQRTHKVYKIPLGKFQKKALYIIDMERRLIITNFNGGHVIKRVIPNLPIYPILWSAVGSHQLGPKEIITTKIYSIKYEV